MNTTTAITMCVLMFVGTVQSQTKPSSGMQTTQPAHYPPSVTLSLDDLLQNRAVMNLGSMETCIRFSPDGTIWGFESKWTCLNYCRLSGSTSGKKAPIPTPGWKFIEKMTAEIDKAGNPVVVWSGHDDTQGEALAYTKWDGQNWSTPKVFDRLEPCSSISNLCSIRDQEGRIHIVYTRPGETYNNWGHGFYAPKCWHAIIDTEKRVRLRSTAKKGKYRAEANGLSQGPNNTLVLSEHIQPMNEEGYLAEQHWDGNSWSKLSRVKYADRGKHISSPWGDQFILVEANEHYTASIIRGKFEETIPWIRGQHIGNKIIVTNDPEGRIVVYSPTDKGGLLAVWNGERWSNQLECPTAEHLITTSENTYLLGCKGGGSIFFIKIQLNAQPQSQVDDNPTAHFTKKKKKRVPSLHKAVISRDIETVREMLKTNPDQVNGCDRSATTPLMYAVRNGDLDMVTLLLKANADPDRGDWGMMQTPLHAAAKSGHLEIAKLLLKYETSVNDEDIMKKTPLAYATDAGHTELVTLLKEHGGTLRDYENLLTSAVQQGDKSQVLELLDRGLSINTTVPNGQCLLDFAAEEGHIEIAQLLIEKGADVKRKDRNERTALHWAAWHGQADMVAFLIKQGADPNAQDSVGETPLHFALQFDIDLDTIKQLVVCGAKADISARDGSTPLSIAKNRQDKTVYHFLLEQKKDYRSQSQSK